MVDLETEEDGNVDTDAQSECNGVRLSDNVNDTEVVHEIDAVEVKEFDGVNDGAIDGIGEEVGGVEGVREGKGETEGVRVGVIEGVEVGVRVGLEPTQVASTHVYGAVRPSPSHPVTLAFTISQSGS
jgi:hypothetical protein